MPTPGKPLRPSKDNTLLGRVERLGPDLTSQLRIPRDLFGDLPGDEPLDVEELRERLLGDATPLQLRDRVWVWLTGKVRAEGGDWCTVAAWLAMPALVGEATRLAPAKTHDTEHKTAVQLDLVVEFIFALNRMDLNRPHIAVDAAAYAARGGRRRREPWAELDDTLAADAQHKGRYSSVSNPVPGHPEWASVYPVACTYR